MKVVLLTILMFAVMILIHECGHFAFAKLFRVKVNEFSLGMGPQIVAKTWGETKYAIRALPIGGYVSMEGENEDSGDPRAFCAQKAWKRFLIVCAGALMNIILGFVLLVIVFAPAETVSTTVVSRFRDGAVTCDSGLQVGDQLLKINGHAIWTDKDVVMLLLSSDSADMEFVVKRDGERITLPNVHFLTQAGEDGEKDQLFIGFWLAPKKNGVLATVQYAASETLSLGRMVWLSFVDLVTGNVGFDQLSGPVGVGSVVGEVAEAGISSVLNLMAFLTINIGIFNLLPIPALDGGRLFFILVEMIFRKPINRKYEAYVHAAGLILLFGLMIVITLKDIFQLF